LGDTSRGTSSPAFEAVGSIKKIDAEKSLLSIHPNGRDRTVKIDKDAKVLDTNDKPPAGDSTQPAAYKP
jgi:hypothetical protein